MLNEPLLTIQNLKKYFPIKGGFWGKTTAQLKAVDGISFSIYPRKTLGLVGESGCGKSTLGRTILKLYEPNEGSIIFKGEDITHLSPRKMRPKRRHMQMIFQDPYSSLDPRMRVGEIVSEPLIIHQFGTQKEIETRSYQLLEEVGLGAEAFERYPHEFSGGQRQRIGIARSLAMSPDFIVCDEPVSALDVSIQSQILNLLVSLRERYGLSYLFIAHDLAVVDHISDDIGVMYLGEIVELASSEAICTSSKHPYTKALISSIPTPAFDSSDSSPKAKNIEDVIVGDIASALNPPSGCRFHTRCPAATSRCQKEKPMLINLGTTDRPHHVACHYA